MNDTANPLRALCVFCGASPGVRPEYVAAGEALGRHLAARGIALVYGGGSIGMMGAVARAALGGGGRVIGVIPERLERKELAQKGLTELHVVGSMHERKAMMADRSDAFVALPGGYGTLEEFFEVLTWAQLGFHHKPVALMNTLGFFDPLYALLDHMVSEGFVRPQHRGMVLTADAPAPLLEVILAYRPPTVEKWLERNQT